MVAEGGGGQSRMMEGRTIGKGEGPSHSGLSVRILGPLLSFHRAFQTWSET